VFHGSASATRFECAVDGAPYVACTSPASYSRAPGTHSFAVRAADAARAADPTPASATWTVAAPQPPPGGGDRAAEPARSRLTST
jgi:hypothetical protein